VLPPETVKQTTRAAVLAGPSGRFPIHNCFPLAGTLMVSTEASVIPLIEPLRFLNSTTA